MNIILSGGLNSLDYTDCAKSDADFNTDNEINVLDIVQVINLILENRNNAIVHGKAMVTFQEIDNNLNITIKSDSDFSGVQFGFKSENPNIELINNSHVETYIKADNDIARMVSYSMLNDAFDSHTVTYVIHDGANLDPTDIDIIIASTSGHDMEITRTISNEIFSSGPHTFELSGIYPNPFNPSTDVTFTIPSDAFVRLSAYNLQGQEVAVIHDGFQSVGEHSYTWNATNMASGVYYVRLVSGNKAETMKVVLMK